MAVVLSGEAPPSPLTGDKFRTLRERFELYHKAQGFRSPAESNVRPPRETISVEDDDMSSCEPEMAVITESLCKYIQV